MDIGRCFKDAWNLLMKDLAPLAVTAVIGAVVTGVPYLIMMAVAYNSTVSGSVFTFEDDGTSVTTVSSDVNWGAFILLGIVAAIIALVVGAWQYSTLLKMMLRRVREDHAAEMGDMRLGLEGIGGFIAAMLVLGILIGIGFVFLIIPGVILLTIWAYALVLVADKGSGIGEAMSGSSALAKRPGYLMTFVTLLVGGIVVGIVSALLGMIPVVGQIISLFIGVYMIAYIVAMYFQATGETHLLDHALYGAPLPEAAPGAAGFAPAPPAPGTAYPPAPSAPMGGAPAPPAPSAPPPVTPPAPPAPAAPPSAAPPSPDAAAPAAPAPPDVWAAASDPLAQPEPPAPPDGFEPPSTSAPPSEESTPSA